MGRIARRLNRHAGDIEACRQLACLLQIFERVADDFWKWANRFM